MATIAQKITSRSLVLSAKELKGMTNWPDALINDYLSILDNLLTVAGVSDDLEPRVEQNEIDISQNRTAITNNTSDINTNSNNISDNTLNIDNNSTSISNHVASTSQHGVTGNNVGSENFAQELIGGVVLLSLLVADAEGSLSEITTADALDAPLTYDQSQIQGVVDLLNDTKSKHNQLLLDVNAAILVINNIIASMIAAKQMSST